MEELGTIRLFGKRLRVVWDGAKVLASIKLGRFLGTKKGELSAEDLSEIKRISEAGLERLGR